ncbi:SDR family NAD(P)-dependent oxidoreductase [Acetoanaerobium noterae]|uniref:SDR family NAD(P)-dependent oxidoreductase n=1 Tax=Acetoanaerobium noterae TaxID=745369 RepID=UPI003221803B
MKEMSNQEMKNMFSLEGKVAVVTGGAGSLGEGVATGLALHGADVVVTGRTIETLQSTVKKVEELGKRALSIACDVTNEDQVKAMAKKAVDAFGKIDILVTVAGIAKRFPAEEFPVEAFEQVMAINVIGTFIPCKVIGNVMKEQGHGKIITVSSVRAFAGHPGGYAAYGTSKGAVALLTKQLATEWAKYNINVNSVAPTIFWTPLTQEVLEDEKLKKIFLDRIPMGRAALVQDMVGTTVYLSSAASDFITGQIIYVDGGCTAG